MWHAQDVITSQSKSSQSVYTESKDGTEYKCIIQNKQIMCLKKGPPPPPFILSNCLV